MTILELAQTTSDARASLVTGLAQAKAADEASAAAVSFAAAAHESVTQLHEQYAAAKTALLAACDEPVE